MRGWLIAAAVVVALVVAGQQLWDRYSRFDSARWRAVGPNVACRDDTRLRMVGDLVDGHLHIGMTPRRVKALLGTPNTVTRYPNPEREAQEWYFFRNSKRLFGMTRTEYLDSFGHPSKVVPKEGFDWEWPLGVVGSDCDNLFVRFSRGRVVEVVE